MSLVYHLEANFNVLTTCGVEVSTPPPTKLKSLLGGQVDMGLGALYYDTNLQSASRELRYVMFIADDNNVFKV